MITTEQAIGAASAVAGVAAWLYKRQASREDKIDRRLRRLEIGMARIEERLSEALNLDHRPSLVSVSDAPEEGGSE